MSSLFVKPCGAMEAHQTSNLGVQSSSLCMVEIFNYMIMKMKTVITRLMLTKEDQRNQRNE